MKRNNTKKGFSIKELQQQGFKTTKIKGLYVSNLGKAYNYTTGNKLTPSYKGIIVFNGKSYNLAKLILASFCKTPIRSGRISFKNGNNKDFSSVNLEYKSTIKQPPPNKSDLIKCIRLFFEIEKTLKVKNPKFKYYLSQIINERGFKNSYKGKDFEMFLEYMKTEYIYLSKNQNIVFDEFGYTRTNGKHAINKYLNLLIIECFNDLDLGVLKVREFKPKAKTKTQELKDIQKKANESGLSIKIPLRKQSIKEALNDFKSKNTIKTNLKK